MFNQNKFTTKIHPPRSPAHSLTHSFTHSLTGYGCVNGRGVGVGSVSDDVASVSGNANGSEIVNDEQRPSESASDP